MHLLQDSVLVSTLHFKCDICLIYTPRLWICCEAYDTKIVFYHMLFRDLLQLLHVFYFYTHRWSTWNRQLLVAARDRILEILVLFRRKKETSIDNSATKRGKKNALLLLSDLDSIVCQQIYFGKMCLHASLKKRCIKMTVHGWRWGPNAEVARVVVTIATLFSCSERFFCCNILPHRWGFTALSRTSSKHFFYTESHARHQSWGVNRITVFRPAVTGVSHLVQSVLKEGGVRGKG